jgi:hypothetical protein
MSTPSSAFKSKAKKRDQAASRTILFLGLLFNPEDGGDKIITSTFRRLHALYPRRQELFIITPVRT